MEEAANPALEIRGLPPIWRWASSIAKRLRHLAASQFNAEAPLRIETRLSLGPRKSLVLVNCHGRRVLLAVSADAVTAVLELAATRRQARTAKGEDR
jgi:flagellar biogenesis protein FliO